MLHALAHRIRRIKWLNYNLGYLISLGTYFKAAVSSTNNPERKFVIYGSGRSGSTLLVSLLDSHSQIFCDNEIYHRRVIAPARYLNLRTRMGGKPVYGFKLLTYHLGAMLGLEKSQFNGYLKSLHEQGYRIIYLRRDDNFRQALSNLYARQSKQFHNKGQVQKAKPKVPIDIQELDNWRRGLRRQQDLEQEYLAGIPHLAITYEAHLADGEKQLAALETIYEFLEIPFEAPKTSLKKNTPKSFESFIENHAEVTAYFQEVILPQQVKT